MRVLVTGATGFVGSHVVERLVRSGEKVAMVVRPGAPTWRLTNVAADVVAIAGDIFAPETLMDGVCEFAPDVMIHLAWHGVSNEHRNASDQFMNVQGVESAISIARRSGARSWIGLGSQAEYGLAAGPLDETSATRPTSAYGKAKLQAYETAEELCRRHRLRFAWLRLFSAYGPKDNPCWMIPSLIQTLLRRDRPSLTAGEQRWDWLYVDDAAEAICATALAPAADGLFNVGSGHAVRVRDVAEAIRDLIDASLPLGLGDVAYRDDQVMLLEANIERLRRATGWMPRTPLADGLRRTVDWYRDHQH